MNMTVHTVRSAVYGAAVGDAVGVPYEFRSPGEMRRHPATDMEGNGTYHMPAGTWSDDTSMILCTLDRLDESLDYGSVMDAFVSWVDEGKYTPFGSCFDIGHTTRMALVNYACSHDPFTSGLRGENNNGNGSLMRIIPAALYAAAHGLSEGKALELAHKLSSLTHAHEYSLIGCGIYTVVAMELLRSPDKPAVLRGLAKARELYTQPETAQAVVKYRRVLGSEFASLSEHSVKSSGYVVDTLECALWCLLNTDSYRECILKAVNFGEDTDTAACVAGALAGLLYGYDGIPSQWRSRLVNPAEIDSAITNFCKRNQIG